MAILTTATLQGYSSCKVAAVTADTTSSLTYGTLYEAYLGGDFSANADLETNDLGYNNNPKQNKSTRIYGFALSGTMKKVPLDVLAIFEGATVVAGGSGDAETQTKTNAAGDECTPFKLAIATNTGESDAGDVKQAHFSFLKCYITDISYTISDGYAEVSFSADAIRSINSSNISTIEFLETAAAIS